MVRHLKGHCSPSSTFIRLTPMALESASPLRFFFKETIPESGKTEFSNGRWSSAFSDTGKIYYYILVTAMFRTALEEYCIYYITPLGVLLTLKCLVRLAKDLNKENSSTKASSYFIAVMDKKRKSTLPPSLHMTLG